MDIAEAVNGLSVLLSQHKKSVYNVPRQVANRRGGGGVLRSVPSTIPPRRIRCECGRVHGALHCANRPYSMDMIVQSAPSCAQFRAVRCGSGRWGADSEIVVQIRACGAKSKAWHESAPRGANLRHSARIQTYAAWIRAEWRIIRSLPVRKLAQGSVQASPWLAAQSA